MCKVLITWKIECSADMNGLILRIKIEDMENDTIKHDVFGPFNKVTSEMITHLMKYQYATAECGALK
jgi:hypothetical protein